MVEGPYTRIRRLSPASAPAGAPGSVPRHYDAPQNVKASYTILSPLSQPPLIHSATTIDTAQRRDMGHRILDRPAAAAAVVVSALAVGVAGGVGGYALLAGDAGSTPPAAVATAAATPSASGTLAPVASVRRAAALSITDIYKTASPGVVEITVVSASAKATRLSPFGQPGGEAEGSGFVLDTAGNIATNQHVVDGGGTIRVKFQSGREVDATLVGSDPSTDLAVIKVDVPAAELKPIPLGDSTAVEVGEGVVAIGSPFGLEGSITAGIVSALGRDIQSPNGYPIANAIQTDAAINHGNSGGPLLNDAGKVIGVNAQIQSDGGGNDGVGFAIPSATVKQVTSQLIATGKIAHAYLGARITTVSQRAATALGIPRGVLLVQISAGGPAADAGLKAGTTVKTVDGQRYTTDGDVVTAAGGAAVLTTGDLRAALDAKKPGETIALTVVRSGATRTVTVTLGTRPA